MNRYLTATIATLLGAVVGFMGCWLYFQKSFTEATSVSLDMFASALYTYELNEAESQFSSANRDVAIYALDRAVRNLKSFQDPKYMTCRNTAYSLGKFNVRLAQLYGETGNHQARDKHLKNAMASYETVGWKLKNTDELQEAIPLIESGNTAEALKTYGELITPCDMK